MLFSLAATWTIVSSVNETVSLLATSASVNSYASISDITEPEFNGAAAVEPAYPGNQSGAIDAERCVRHHAGSG